MITNNSYWITTTLEVVQYQIATTIEVFQILQDYTTTTLEVVQYYNYTSVLPCNEDNNRTLMMQRMAEKNSMTLVPTK